MQVPPGSPSRLLASCDRCPAIAAAAAAEDPPDSQSQVQANALSFLSVLSPHCLLKHPSPARAELLRLLWEAVCKEAGAAALQASAKLVAFYAQAESKGLTQPCLPLPRHTRSNALSNVLQWQPCPGSPP